MASVCLENLSIIPLSQIIQAKEFLKDKVMKTPLVPLNLKCKGKEIWLKLENLQYTGSFKVRGALNAVHSFTPGQLADGVWTCSAGNFAQGLCKAAKDLNLPCSVVVPDTAPITKVHAIEVMGGVITKVPYEEWWNIMMTQQMQGMRGQFIHPVCHQSVIAGHGTIGLEILEDCPDVDTIIIPVGGGGNLSGIASAVKSHNKAVKIIGCEVEGAAPLTASRQTGEPKTLQQHTKTFVDGMGGRSVLSSMWSLLQSLCDDTVVLSLEEICQAVRHLLMYNKVLAEGAGAAPVAAALKPQVTGNKIVCVVSGGNLDVDVLKTILNGHIPN